MLWRRLAALALIATGAFAAEEEETELRQLNEDNFKASIAHGAWLVEHFSPRCWHCKAFAPTWTDLANKKAYHEQLSGFHMAQVNCLAQGDLCNSNNIRGCG
jgi:thioredoxin-like negative regulator of GroEL